MSEDVELVRRAIKLVEDGSVEDLASLLHPQCEWISDPRIPGGGTFQGRARVAHYLNELRRAFRTLTLEIHELRDSERGILATMTAHGRGRVSGVEAPLSYLLLIQVKDGVLTRLQSFLDPGEALEAAGEPRRSNSATP